MTWRCTAGRTGSCWGTATTTRSPALTRMAMRAAHSSTRSAAWPYVSRSPAPPSFIPSSARGRSPRISARRWMDRSPQTADPARGPAPHVAGSWNVAIRPASGGQGTASAISRRGRESHQHLVALPGHLQDHAFPPFAVDDVVARPKAEFFGPMTAHRSARSRTPRRPATCCPRCGRGPGRRRPHHQPTRTTPTPTTRPGPEPQSACSGRVRSGVRGSPRGTGEAGCTGCAHRAGTRRWVR